MGACAEAKRWPSAVLALLVMALAAATGQVITADVQAQQRAVTASATQQCRRGVLSADNKFCCQRSCGGCAQRVKGVLCSKLPGGAANCCPNAISKAKSFCSTKNASTPPCRVNLCVAPCAAVKDQECQKPGKQQLSCASATHHPV